MQTEFEVKILEIDVDKIISKLESLNATKIREKNQRRYVYDLIPKKENSWIRLRTDGNKSTLTIKEIHNDNIDGTKELEVSVDNFKNTNIILERLGFKSKSYQENKRISYKLDDVELEIDFWPKIPAYLEIEGKSIEDVEKMIEKLGFKKTDVTSISCLKIYKKYGIDLEKIKELKFEL